MTIKKRKDTKSNGLSEAYNKGYEAFMRGNLINPYRPRSYFWKEWERGFNASYFSNLAF